MKYSINAVGVRSTMNVSPDLSKCAVPLCSKPWHRMSEGKLFVFHVRNASSGESEVKKVWLCEECFESWEAMVDRQGHVLLQPLMRMAS